MGNSCHSKQHSMAGAAPAGGRFVATAAPDKPRSPLGNHVIGNYNNFVKKGRKAGVLTLNDPLPDSPPPQRTASPDKPKEATEDEDAVASKKEQQKIKQEEARRKKQEKAEEAKQRRLEAETQRRAEKEAEEAKKRRQEADEAQRRQEKEAEETARRLEAEAEELRRRADEQRRLEVEEAAKEEARRRQEEMQRRRHSDAARAETYSLRQLRSSYLNDFPTFLVNNTLMAVQFAPSERELFERVRGASNADIRETEMSARLSATGHSKMALCPDALHEHLAQAVRFIPEDDPYVATGIPLRPLRVMINHEDIKVRNQQNYAENSRKIQLSVEQANFAGYVRLLNMDPRMARPRLSNATLIDPDEGYPSFSDVEEQNLVPAAVRVPEATSSDSDPDERRPSTISWGGVTAFGGAPMNHLRVTPGGSSGSSSGDRSAGSILSVPKSNYSNSDSENSYSTIASLRKQQLLAERRQQLSGAAASKSGLPYSCFAQRAVRSYGGSSDQLYRTKHYLSSTAFMDNFSVVFADMMSKDLGFLPIWTDEATVCGAAISVKTTSAKLEITPTVRCTSPGNWPEKAVEWILRNRVEAFDQRTQQLYRWPSSTMIQEVIGKGYHLVPIGFMPKKGANPAFDREWRIEFPQAERYLETCLSDTQLRCHIFCLLLFQVFFKIEHSVTEDHLRHVLFWQAENLTLAWANYEMYNNIRAVYESLIERLSRKDMPNYFIRMRNDFQSIPFARLSAVQRSIHDFKANPFGHLIAALRRLHIPGANLGFDMARLLNLIKTTYTVELVNPDLKFLTVDPVEPRKKTSADEQEGIWAEAKKLEDPKKAWKRKLYLQQQQLQRNKQQQYQTRRRESEPVRVDRPLVEVDVNKMVFNSLRRRLILEFFVEHFVQVVAGPGRPRPSSETFNHARNLLLLLSEQTGGDDSRVDQWRMQLQRVRAVSSQAPRSRLAQRGPLELPPGEMAANWTLQDGQYRGRRLMRDAPPTMVFRSVDEESEPPESEETDL